MLVSNDLVYMYIKHTLIAHSISRPNRVTGHLSPSAGSHESHPEHSDRATAQRHLHAVVRATAAAYGWNVPEDHVGRLRDGPRMPHVL